MNSSRQYLSDFSRQSLAVDFIETRLNMHHQAFATPPSQYDPNLHLFVISEPQASQYNLPVGSYAMHPVQATAVPALLPGGEDQRLAPRPLAKPSEVLKFWDSLFEPAMKKFKDLHPAEPPEIIQKQSSIRDKKDWTSVFNQL